MALVKIASSRSRGDAMILHPTTPQALQPKPMHMVSEIYGSFFILPFPAR
jgi:hypothetical protein